MISSVFNGTLCNVLLPFASTLFLGLVDLAIVNGYIVHRAYHAGKSTRPLTHVQYIRKLHLELIHLKSEDMYEENKFGAGKFYGDVYTAYSRCTNVYIHVLMIHLPVFFSAFDGTYVLCRRGSSFGMYAALTEAD